MLHQGDMHHRFSCKDPQGYTTCGTLWRSPWGHIGYMLDTSYYLHGTKGHVCWFSLADPECNETSLQTAMRAASSELSNAEVKRPKLGLGQYYPRMYRQISEQNPLVTYGAEFTGDMIAFDLLETELERIFEVVEPGQKTIYGHRLRQLLISACTEVENQLKRILMANSYPAPKSDRYSTADYVKVGKALRLGEFFTRLARYPSLPMLSPFKGWDASAPTQSLLWYDAYNATKHDRALHLERATLEHVLNAVAAVHILLVAQFGIGFPEVTYGRTTLLTQGHGPRVFKLDDRPIYPLDEQYIPPLDGSSWVPVNYSF